MSDIMMNDEEGQRMARESKGEKAAFVPPQDIRARFRRDYYKTKLPWVNGRKDAIAHQAYVDDQARLDEEFRRDLYKEFDVENNEKRDQLFAKAYEMGHANGMYEVFIIFEDLVELIK